MKLIIFTVLASLAWLSLELYVAARNVDLCNGVGIKTDYSLKLSCL